jgi:hypothetical protein
MAWSGENRDPIARLQATLLKRASSPATGAIELSIAENGGSTRKRGRSRAVAGYGGDQARQEHGTPPGFSLLAPVF